MSPDISKGEDALAEASRRARPNFRTTLLPALSINAHVSNFKWTLPSLARDELTHSYEPLQPHLLMPLAGQPLSIRPG